MSEQNLKTCSQCKTPKPLSFFVRDKSRTDKRHPSCKACKKIYNYENRHAIVAKVRAYREKFPEKIKEAHKKYTAKRFFYHRANNLKLRHVGEQSASTKELASLWKEQRGLCAVTGRRLTKANAQLDHIIPLVEGGVGARFNLRWVHRDVNYAKRDLSDAAFLQLCKEVAARN